MFTSFAAREPLLTHNAVLNGPWANRQALTMSLRALVWLALAASSIGSAHARWVQQRATNPVTGESIVSTTAKSEPNMQLGSARAVLSIRQRTYDGESALEVWIGVPGLAVQCFDRCQINWKVDTAPFRGVSGIVSDDGATDGAFLGGEQYIVDDLLASKRLLVEIPIYRRGRHVFAFDVSNFVMPTPPAQPTSNASPSSPGAERRPTEGEMKPR